MSRRLKLGLAAALLFLVGTIGMTAWFYYAPHRAVTRLHQALRSSDTNALAREIDFPAFQASLKQQIRPAQRRAQPGVQCVSPSGVRVSQTPRQVCTEMRT